MKRVWLWAVLGLVSVDVMTVSVAQLNDGEHVIEGDLLLPATAAHNRVHPRTASP